MTIATVRAPTAPAGRVVLEGISWATYETLLAEIGTRGGIRLTYDRGVLEIMVTSHEHESYKKLTGRLIEALTLELEIPIKSGGSTTFKSALLEKGLEPDECTWVAKEPRMRGKKHFDLARDPPPDLAVEIEITRSALDKLGIYAALGIAEVWRWSDEEARLVFEALGKRGRAREVARSRSFPFLASADLTRFLVSSSVAVDETTWMRGFVRWVREELAPRR